MRFEKQNLFFISDFHVGHENVIRFDGRPFENVGEMHEALISNWNRVVGDEDIVFYLGDLSMRCHISTVKWFVEQLNGKIHFLMGNHDKYREIRNLGRFEKIWGDDDVQGAGKIQVRDETVKGGWQHIEMSHYPILSWNKHHHSAWHLHGHCHQSLTKNPDMSWYYKRKVMDVGCNGLDYTPISYLELKNIMDSKGVSLIDHHEG
jgi:calcineurin-like phosphoesterase family protein